MPKCRFVTLLAAAAVLGCRPAEEIHSYTVAKQVAPATAAIAVEPTSALHYTAPASWQELPAGGFRKAVFRIADGDKEALVTVIDFPAAEGLAIADPLANVNRWRAEVGLDPISRDQLSDVVGTIDVGGQRATYVAALPDSTGEHQSQAGRGTLAAMVAHGNRVWFFKMTGSRDLVAAQQDEFRSFLESVRFAAGGGAGNGD